MEARSLPADKSRQLNIKVKEYKADLLSLKEQVKAAAGTAAGADAARAELVSIPWETLSRKPLLRNG